jgi:signal transduction histidine kinase
MPQPGLPVRRSRPTAVTWCVTVAALAAMLTTAIVRTGSPTMPGSALVVLVLLSTAVLSLRTLRPVLVLGCVVTIEVCILVFLAVPDGIAERTEGMGAFQPVPLGTMLAAYTVAARSPRRLGWGAGVAAGGVLMVAGLLAHGSVTALTDLVVFYLVVTAAALGAWRAGRRDARERELRRRERETGEAVMEERLRIARELHDVLAHNLTLVNAQAGVAEYLLETQPQAAAHALRDITRHTSRAIDELRATIGLLRYDAASPARDPDDATGPGGPMRPVPGIDALDELVESHRSTGTPVTVQESGRRGTLGQHADLAAYRIVQEALTNAAKHAPGMPVEVSLAWSEAGVRLRVVNAALAAGERRTAAPGTGHGLIGMRERALAAGGGLRVGEIADDRFEVVATLPAGRSEDATDHETTSEDPGSVAPSSGTDVTSTTSVTPLPADEGDRP